MICVPFVCIIVRLVVLFVLIEIFPHFPDLSSLDFSITCEEGVAARTMHVSRFLHVEHSAQQAILRQKSFVYKNKNFGMNKCIRQNLL